MSISPIEGWGNPKPLTFPDGKVAMPGAPFFRPDARMWIVQKPRKLSAETRKGGGGASQPDDLMIMIHQLVVSTNNGII